MRMRMIPPLLTLSANIERTVRGRATNPAKLSRTTSVELFSESGRKCRARAALDCAPLVRGEDQCARQCARKYFRSLSACLPIQVAQYEDHLRNLARPRRWFYRRVSWRYLFRHNRIFIGADLFIHDAGHARQIFFLAKFFSPGSNILREQR